jgi:hypothetical protein
MIMSFNPTWRTQAMETLVWDDINSFENGHQSGLVSVLKFGFQGYSNMTDEELEKELKFRDISTVFGESDDD